MCDICALQFSLIKDLLSQHNSSVICAMWPLFYNAESVVEGPDGQLVMLDRYNNLWEANLQHGTWVLEPEPRARLGVGRPLGYHFDSDGNLIVCDSVKV